MIGREFITAGRAIFTCNNGKGLWFTYKVVQRFKDNGNEKIWYVSALADKKKYKYVGVLDTVTGEVVTTAKSQYKYNDQVVKVIRWALKLVWNNQSLPNGYSIYHEGHCGRCGKALTTPESCATGFGPECRTALGIQ